VNAAAAPRILIVEDERIIAMELQHALADMGYDAYAIASSADEALSCANTQQPDVVLMDIRLKGLHDGIQTAEMLKTRFPVIVIFLTAHADASMINRAKSTIPDAYLVKPVREAELRGAIELALHRRTLDKERQQRHISEHRLYMITENVPIAIAYVDRDGRMQFANQIFRDFVAFHENPIGVSAMKFFGESLYRHSYRHRQRALMGERVSEVVAFEVDGMSRKQEVTYLPDREAYDGVAGVYVIGYDVTDRERLSGELRQAHLDLETILNTVPASVMSWDLDLTNRFANEGAKLRFTKLKAEDRAVHMREAVGDDCFNLALPHIKRALAGQPSSQDMTEKRPKDSRQYSHIYYVPEMNGNEVIGLYTLAFDVTELRQSHEHVRLLAQRLEVVREEERMAVARVLHDGVAQDLFAVRLDLTRLESHAKGQLEVQQICNEMSSTIAKCMDETRQLANELRPVAIGYLNVGAAIRDHARHFGERAHLSICVAEHPGFPALSESDQLLFFRAAQEALTNVARHANAKSVDIKLWSNEQRVAMEVADDGIGLAEGALRKPHSLGLLGLRERFMALGGAVSVEERHPHGTVVTLQLPLNAGYEAPSDRPCTA
jgi:PAS domain S-box-containing protein